MTNDRSPLRHSACWHRPLAIGLATVIASLLLAPVSRAQSAPSSTVPPAPAASTAEPWEDRPALLRVFDQAAAHGTMVVFDTRDRRWIAANSRRAFERFVPASTFKIPNTLIALETGVVSGATQAIPWDGKPRGYTIGDKQTLPPAWNQDQTLTSAFRYSTVWAYQRIAREVGYERMMQAVRGFRYGNADIGNVVDRFWLDGPLKISAVEQIAFLRRFNEGRLPLSARTVAEGRRVMLREDKPGYRLFAKTGTADVHRPGIGWYVGWVEHKDPRQPSAAAAHITYFALNLDFGSETGMDDLAKREPVAHRVLAELGYGLD